MRYCSLREAPDRICPCSTATLPNLPRYNYFLVEKSVAAFVILRGPSQDSPWPLQMVLVQVPQCHHPFGVKRRPEPSIQMCRTSYLFHGSSCLHPPILVVSILQGSSGSAESSPSAAVPFWRLCPSPSRVRHLCSACPTLPPHHPHLPHPPHRRDLQDHSDFLW